MDPNVVKQQFKLLVRDHLRSHHRFALGLVEQAEIGTQFGGQVRTWLSTSGCSVLRFLQHHFLR